MAELHDLFAVDASNIARFPEAQAPSTLNNGARALEGIVARYFFDTNHSVVATLSGSVIQMTANRTSISLTGTTSNYVADLLMAFTMGSVANINNPLININGIGAISLRDNNGASISASVIRSGAKCLIVKDDTNNYFRLLRGGQTASGAVTGNTASTATGVAVTIQTPAPAVTTLYIVWMNLSGNAGGGYSSWAAIIYDPATSPTLTRIGGNNGTLSAITTSGSNIQVSQSSGGNAVMEYGVTRVGA